MADRVLKFDTRSKADIQRIWSIARNDHDLSYESLIDYIDEMADEIDESQKLNFVRWPILNSFVHENPRALGSFEKEVTAMKDYLKVRFNDLDRLYNYDATISGIDEIITDAESSIFVSDNMIVNRGDETFAVYTITGNKIYEGVESTDRLSSGIYIVVSPAGTFKVMIK